MLRRTLTAFAAWRAKKSSGDHLPAALWAKAEHAARVHGTTKTARLLRLNHSTLKRRVVERYGPPAEPAQTFVELPAISDSGPGSPRVQQEATVEVEDAAGFRLRLVFRGLGPQEVAAAARELWSGRA